ncbi:hypothetical protein A2765_04420 [Candidatus Kaiserbacteria bacterium RIFCSPHIGHO2_01_FULL_56_24]|uniref:Uncharacterized protein n=1 Tax=Candidatus Kaiserbacteria bacterium RIFCSPHIGHO2_01_FULL_56_24 TaxID=1798487 RepID=A0A1F6DEE3_9BACT|nr:MAG: hypothetical protein A2765_04420 [Candidatus Kaiserbacteria bacterium RIFCSPHIGHO2_01_FULL_56_24]
MDGLVSFAIVLGALAQFVIAALLIVVLWYLILILRDIRDITDRLRRGSELIAGDLSRFRRAVYDESEALWSSLKAFVKYLPQVLGFAGKKRARKAKQETEKDEPAEASDLS